MAISYDNLSDQPTTSPRSLCPYEGAVEHPPFWGRAVLTAFEIREDETLSTSALSGPGLRAQFAVQ
jgi:hypothetical protein